jgi:hypothetical protein
MKTVRGLAVFAAAVTLSSTAHAATCKSQLARAEKATGAAVVPAYTALMKCDADIGSQNFEKVMQNAGDAETLVGISMVAIEADQWNPVWGMIGKISDYSAQDRVAWLIGEQCANNEKVASFLQGAYFGLRDIEFARWDDALVSCEADSFDAWMIGKIEDPPDKLFDEKWNAVATAYVEKKGAEALPHFAVGAVKAAEIGGPYETILQHMEATVQPALGDEMPEADMSALADALSTVANGVTPEQARSVADRLANSGSEAAAAALLPTIYPDRVQSGGGFHYGAVAVELADCKGTQSATLHVATVQDTGGRYMIQSAIDGPMRGMKPKLTKCTAAAEAWPVYVTEAPLAGKGDIEALVTSVADQWAAKDYVVKRKDEKPVVLD